MKNTSPLRYPGGKSAMSGLLGQIRKLNNLSSRSIAEPFAGGAGASLTLLYLEEVHEIHINDADPAIHDFWWSVIRSPKPFRKLIESSNLTISEWRHQKDLYRTRNKISRLRRGFAAFYLNRCNRSGIIINGGPIGGLNQTGKWKLDARFNKFELAQRCERVAEYGERIHLSQCDGIGFIKGLKADRTFFFIDPPYFEKGKTLYLNALDPNYHATLATHMKSMREAAWVITYDDCPEIRSLYKGWASIRPFSLRYAAAERRKGREVLITPKWFRLPSSQSSAAITW